MKYPTAIKAKMIKKMTGPRAVSAVALSRETGIPQPTLSRWLRSAATVKHVSSRDKKETETPTKRPEDWTPEEKLRAVLETDGLGEAQLGVYLRRHGLHAEHLEQWRVQATDALGTKPKRRGRSAEQKRIRKLERELARKEKALAEAAALLVLKKKLETFYGEDEDDDTDEGNDR